jgi:epoxide hydrolase 4
MTQTERMVEVDRAVRLHVVEDGPTLSGGLEGPGTSGASRGDTRLVVLLHGFPEFWYSWRKQIPALAAAGFRVVAPDMRGYNLSDKPRGVAQYRLDLLTQDVRRLLDQYGAERAHVVGHDWGAVVAWAFAMQHPQRLDRLGILNVPHPVSFERGLKTFKQLRKSWYVYFFQLPWLPEMGASRNQYAFVRRALRSLSPEDVERYVEAIARPGALTSAINYYRALVRFRAHTARQLRRIEQPVLVIWGERDNYLGRELANPPREWVPDHRVVRFPNASHWVQNDEPEPVNQLLIDFLR